MSQLNTEKSTLESNIESVHTVYGPIDKSRAKSTGIVSRLWRNICTELSISPDYIFREVRRWVNSISSGIPNTGSARSTERGNIIKELVRPQMSLQVLIKVLVVVLGARGEIQFSVTFKRRGRREPETFSLKIDDAETYVKNSRKRRMEE